jgi:hypothetical protein
MPLRSRGFASRVRWTLMPWWAFAWRYRNDDPDDPNPGRWWHHCIGSTALWLDKLLERLPGGALFEPMPRVECDCDYCRGVPGAVFEP